MRAPNFFSLSNSVSDLLATMVRFALKTKEAGERRRAVHSLASLDDHMLRDIGLTRFDVDAALVEPALTDATLVLAERARELCQHQRALAQEAKAWATPEADGRGAETLARRAA